jgi:hypothetical protein
MADHRRTSDVETVERPVESNGKRDHHEEAPPIKEIRASDIEPYTGLRYLSKLFRFMAIIVILLIAAEVITGISAQGAASIPTLLGEASRLIVLAGVLWGTGDLAHLLIDVGHDVRASRILLARQTYQATLRGGSAERVTVSGLDRIGPVADRSVTASPPPPIP